MTGGDVRRDATLLLNRVLARSEPFRRRAELRRIVAAFEHRTVLEIGGPSRIFERGQLLPIYPEIEGYDAANYAPSTIWDGQGGAFPQPRREIVTEASALDVEDAAYEGLLASHVLEHLANPVGALQDWRRAVQPGSPLLIVIPHRDYTFDHRRPPTPTEHMLEDARQGTGEEDLTHLPEILRLHDPRHDYFDGDWAAFEQRGRDNLSFRAMHHHVFTTATAVETVTAAGLRVEAVTARRPHHIVLLCRAQEARQPDTGPDLTAALRASPFPSDRAAA